MFSEFSELLQRLEEYQRYDEELRGRLVRLVGQMKGMPKTPPPGSLSYELSSLFWEITTKTFPKAAVAPDWEGFLKRDSLYGLLKEYEPQLRAAFTAERVDGPGE